MKRHFLSINAACLLLALLAAAPVFSQSNIPQMINYQGYLTDAQGKPVAPDAYELSFSIYATADGTTPVWGPQVMENVPVVDGHFNVILGPTDNDGKSIALAFTGAEAYLGITVEKTSDEGEGTVVGGDIMPRQRILSTPYAMNGVPAGTIVAYGGSAQKIPEGWLLCNGKPVSSADYPALWDSIGTFWGNGTYDPVEGDFDHDAKTNFNLPDLRGLFLRGNDLDSGKDPEAGSRTEITSGGATGSSVGSYQGFAMQKHKHNDKGHTHTYRLKVVVHNGNNIDGQKYQWKGDSVTDTGYANLGDPVDSGTGAGTVLTSTETRPKNASVNYIIKF